MNKKKYITPKIDCIDIDCESILLNTSTIDSGGEDFGHGKAEAPVRRGADWQEYYNL